MGSESEQADDDEKPVTRVEISEGYWMGKHEVTQGEWEAVMGSNPSSFEDCGSDCPVEWVSWEEAQEYIRRLNARERWRGYSYRLPSEAEWESAAGRREGGECVGIARHAGECVGVGGGQVRGIPWRIGDGSEGTRYRLEPGAAGRRLVQQRSLLPVVVSLLRHPRRPQQHPRVPPPEDRITLCTLTLLPFATYRVRIRLGIGKLLI